MSVPGIERLKSGLSTRNGARAAMIGIPNIHEDGRWLSCPDLSDQGGDTGQATSNFYVTGQFGAAGISHQIPVGDKVRVQVIQMNEDQPIIKPQRFSSAFSCSAVICYHKGSNHGLRMLLPMNLPWIPGLPEHAPQHK